MESFSELIKNRRSMRKFTTEELTQDEVVTLMKAALMAPTSKRSNSWQFVVVDDKETLKRLSMCKAQAAQFIADAALAVVVLRLLYNVGSLNRSPMVLSFRFSLSVIIFTFASVESTFCMAAT